MLCYYCCSVKNSLKYDTSNLLLRCLVFLLLEHYIRVRAQMARDCGRIDDSKWLGPISVSAARSRTPGMGGAAPGGSADLFQDPSHNMVKVGPAQPPPSPWEQWAHRGAGLMCQEASTLLIRSAAEPKLKRKRACRRWWEGNTSELKLSFHFDLNSAFIPSFPGQKCSLKSPKSTLVLSNPVQ